MDARELKGKMNYLGMERAARRILLDDGLVKAEDVAMMTSVEVCDKILEFYEVVSCESDNITIVKHEDMETYKSITKFLSR